MNRSLYSKLVMIILLLIVSLMAVVGAFLMRGIRIFYLNEFYQQMRTVFSSVELATDLRSAADEPDAEYLMADILWAYSGPLGIDSGRRNYYILSGDTGGFMTGSNLSAGPSLMITPNILTAISGSEGYRSDSGADYMDVALPVSGAAGNYIVYIIDNKNTVSNLSSELFSIILESLLIGLVISALLGLLLAKTMITPIQSLTRAAERVAGGDFSDKLDIRSKDEIGVLASTFNDMANQLENTLDNLKKSEMTRREFVANVSHELRTPITSIRSYAETLSDSGGMPKNMEKKFLNVIVTESDRMTKIVQDLLYLSRFDAGNYEFSREKFSFEKSVRDVYNAMLLEARRRNHELSFEFFGKLPEITGDRPRLEQVIINMVSNAIKYTPDGGRIKITAGETDGSVWVSVRDNGIGIPKEDLEHVFERFYRVDKARSRESGGTGLGLSIASEIVASHNGKMEIESRLGRGTTIKMILPVSQEQ